MEYTDTIPILVWLYNICVPQICYSKTKICIVIGRLKCSIICWALEEDPFLTHHLTMCISMAITIYLDVDKDI